MQDSLDTTLKGRGTHRAGAAGPLELDLHDSGHHVGADQCQVAPVGLDGGTHEFDDRVERGQTGTALVVGEIRWRAGSDRVLAFCSGGDICVHEPCPSIGPRDRHQRAVCPAGPHSAVPGGYPVHRRPATAPTAVRAGQSGLTDGRDPEASGVPCSVPPVQPFEPPGAIGLILPTLVQDTVPAWVDPGDGTGTDADPLSDLADLCHQAEVAGAGALWACDHLFWHGPCLECMVVLTVAAMATERAAVGSCIIQLPLRRAVAVAKQAATIQSLSRGRMILGVGVGSHPGEYEQVGAAYHSRGHDLDTGIGELHRAWRSGDGKSLGDTSSTDPTERYRQLPAPSPVPVWVGGSSNAALRRAAHRADGWMPLFLSVDEYGDAVERLGKEVDASGRPSGAVTPAMVLFVSIDDDAERGTSAGTEWMGSLYGLPPKAFERHLVAGTAEQVAARVAEYRAAGAEHVAVYVTDDRPIQQFARLTAALPAAGVPIGR